ncbi:sensor histidine kinase [Tessaracoccus coleopterorum]|uniref:sensor histidine kinase n=1 Tax=Tessaracoccus coleopterorum TaxID=2714950 RepID=UPI002F913311
MLPTAVEVALLRTAQSAIANVRLHADASRAVMSLIDDGQTVRLDLIDDGRGFDVRAWEAGTEPTMGASGYGLRFMRARLRELGGGIDVESAPARAPRSPHTCPSPPAQAGPRRRRRHDHHRVARRRPSRGAQRVARSPGIG